MSPYCIQSDSFRQVAQTVSVQTLQGIFNDIDLGKDVLTSCLNNNIYQVSGDLAGLLSGVPQVYPGLLNLNNPQMNYIGNSKFSDSFREKMNRDFQDLFPYKPIAESEVINPENKIDLLWRIFGEYSTSVDFCGTFLNDLDKEMKVRRSQSNGDIWLDSIHQYERMLEDYPELNDLRGSELTQRMDSLKINYDKNLANKNGGFLIWELSYLRTQIVSRIYETFYDFRGGVSVELYEKSAQVLYNFIQAIKKRNPDFPLLGTHLINILRTSVDDMFVESGIFNPYLLKVIRPHIDQLIKEFNKIQNDSI